MRPDGMRFSGRHRGWFHGTFGLLFLSGAGWWILHRFFPVHGEFGPRPHPWQPGLMMIHGGAAMLAIKLSIVAISTREPAPLVRPAKTEHAACVCVRMSVRCASRAPDSALA